MGPLEIIGGILLILTSVFIVIAVTLQQPKGNGLGTIAGGGEQYLSKGKSRTMEATLAKVTKISAIVLFVVTIAVSAVIAYLK